MNDLLLQNKTILVTRDFDSDNYFRSAMVQLGADVIHLPAIKIVPVDDYTEFDKQIEAIDKFDYLIFSSSNAVKYFTNRIIETGTQLDYKNISVVAVGTATERTCKDFNIPVNIIPEEFSGAGVYEELKKYELKNKNILIPSSVISRQELKEKLEQEGANVFITFVYDNIIPPLEEIKETLAIIKNRKPDLFVFTSPSTFNNYIELLEIDNIDEYFAGTKIAAIGSVTAAAIADTGLNVDIVPDKFTMNSLTEKIVNYYNH